MSYPRFIEVHGVVTGQAINVNVENIIMFADSEIVCTNMDWKKKEGAKSFRVLETYDELKQLIHDAGCAIAKRDPRLDWTKPLTLEELKTMIGEPVWDIHDRKWGLVSKFDDGAILLTYDDCSDQWYDADDLIKFPMYRMKEADK